MHGGQGSGDRERREQRGREEREGKAKEGKARERREGEERGRGWPALTWWARRLPLGSKRRSYLLLARRLGTSSCQGEEKGTYEGEGLQGPLLAQRGLL